VTDTSSVEEDVVEEDVVEDAGVLVVIEAEVEVVCLLPTTDEFASDEVEASPQEAKIRMLAAKTQSVEFLLIFFSFQARF